MKANLIKTLKNTAELVDIEAGRSARRNFPGVDFENAVLIINGRIAEPDTIIQEGDVVTLRQIPGDLTETPWWVSTFIIPFGFLIAPIEIGVKAQQQADEAQRELDKIKRLTNQPSIDNTPFLRGANNSIATGKTQPYLCGRNFMTPYLFSKPYYKVAGTDGIDQYVYQIFEGGFKNIVLEKLGIGDTVIKTLTEQTPQNGVYTINDGVFAEGVVEIRQNGDAFSTLTELNKKIVSTVANKEIPRAAVPTDYFTFTLDPYAKDVEICVNFPYGLYAFDINNIYIPEIVALHFEYSLDGGSTWNMFYLDSGETLYRMELKALRFLAHHTFTLSDYATLIANNQKAITIRVSEVGLDDSKHKNNCYVYYYQSTCYDPQKSSTPAGVLNDGGAAGLVDCLNVEPRERAMSCVIGLKLKATKSNEDKLTQFNFIATSTARTWNGSAWSDTKAPTRNPAAIALEILTSDTHAASRYADSEIDLDAFGALYEYCENNGLKFDYTITQNQKKDATLQIIADVCGCAFYKDIYGRRSVAIDQAQENAVAVYNPQNIISLTNKKTFARRVDALRIRYIDSANDTYKENTYTVTRLENGQPVIIDENSIIKEITAPGITTHAQVVKYGRRLMAIDELRPVTTTLKIGFEGVYFTPYAKIGIQDPSINRDAQDTVIKEVVYQYGLLKKIILRNPVTFTDPLKIYGIVINTVTGNGAVPLALKVEGSGETNELVPLDDYAQSEDVQPAAGNVASFGELDANGEFTNITHEYVITRISRGDGGFNLEMQEYNEAIYEPGAIPAYKPIVNNTPTPSAEEIPPELMTAQEVEAIAASVAVPSIQEAIDTIQNGNRFTNIYNVRPVTDTLEEIVARMDDEARDRSASISISEDEILLQVQDMERELVGLIDIQAGAVTALVEGGGASGQMSLSLNLPVMIDATKRAQLIAASSAAKVNAVYGLVEGTEYYGIKGNASNAAVKALWDDIVAANLIASQIDLRATQINLNGDNIYVNGSTMFTGEVGAKLIKAALIDVENILVKNMTVKDKGVIHSENYNGTINANGQITAYGTSGWAIDHLGKADFVNLNATGGLYSRITCKNIVLQEGLRFFNRYGGVTVSDLISFMRQFCREHADHGSGQNIYLACGLVNYYIGGIWYTFTTNFLDIQYENGVATVVYLRGLGTLTTVVVESGDTVAETYNLIRVDLQANTVGMYPVNTLLPPVILQEFYPSGYRIEFNIYA